ncbi:MAG: sigma-70 family RNA polymerase sigma factor [Kiritimatiellae bacterium]|nr:sigma-70 family RNA polymerase sigma factor [Kiritimatiellia bacterium]
MTDSELLGRFVEEQSEEAFRELVDRQQQMVYRTCLRGLEGDAAGAEDAAQAVFILLARRAAGIRNRAALTTWLFRTAHSVVSHMQREAARRRQRERTAVEMSELERRSRSEVSWWTGVGDAVNQAIAALGPRYRQAVVLHFLQGLSHRQVADQMGCSEAAVNKRIVRALAGIRTRLLKRGVTASVAALGAYLLQESAQAVPAGLSASCQAVAIGSLAGGTRATSAAAAIAKGVMQTMKWAQIKKAAALVCIISVVAAAAIAAVTAATRPYEVRTEDGLGLTLSGDGQITGLQLDQGMIPLIRPGGFAVQDVAASPDELNRVKNPGFEDRPADWTPSDGQALDTAVSHTGGHSLRLHVPGPEKASRVLEKRVCVTGGRFYRIGCWMKTSDCPQPRFYVSEFGADGKISGDEKVVSLDRPRPDGEWHHSVGVLRLASGTCELRLQAVIKESTGTLWLDDISVVPVGGDALRTMSGRVERRGSDLTLSAASAEQRLSLRSVFRARPHGIDVVSELEDSSGKDRAVLVAFRLPLDAQGWNWGIDVHEWEKVEKPTTYEHIYDCKSGLGFNSVYPFSALSGKEAGLSLALPLAQGPRSFRIVYDNVEKEYVIEFYLALSRKTERFPQKAAFSFSLYRYDPAWGMRAAARKYYGLYPDSFRKRTPYEGYIGYARLERPDPTAHALHRGREAEPVAQDSSDFGEGYGFIAHMHGSYQVTRLPTEDSKYPSEEAIWNHLRELGQKNEWTSYVPVSELIKKIAVDRHGKVRAFSGYTRWDPPHQGRNKTDRAGWSLHYHVYESPDVSDWFAKDTARKTEAYLKNQPDRQPFDAILTADGACGYSTNRRRLNYREEHFRRTTFPLTFGCVGLKPAIMNNIWDFYQLAWWPMSEEKKVLINGNANGYGTLFALHFLDLPMTELADWDRHHPGRVARYMRTMAYRKNWRYCYAPRDGDVKRRFDEQLPYAFFPALYVHLGNIEAYRPLYRRYVPVIEKLAAAGWEPVTHARSPDAAVCMERYGAFGDDNLCITARNYSKEGREVAVTLDAQGLGIDAAASAQLTAWDLMSTRILPVRDGVLTLEIEAEGAAAFRIGTPAGHARYALGQTAEGLRRIGRLFATDLTAGNRAQMSEAHGIIDSALASSDAAAVLRAAETLQTKLTELESAIPTQAPVDRAKAFYRIRQELSEAVRAVLRIDVAVPASPQRGVLGEAPAVQMTVANYGSSSLDRLAAAALSPWPAVMQNCRAVGVPPRLGPGQEVTVGFALAVPEAPERQLLPFLLEIRGACRGQAFRFYVPIDVQTASPLAVTAETQGLTIGAEQKLSVRVENRASRAAPLTLALGVPAGWSVQPAQQPVRLAPGAAGVVEFTVAVPDGTAGGSKRLAVSIRGDSPRFTCSETLRVDVTDAESGSEFPSARIEMVQPAPRIDGDLSEACWQGEPTISSLLDIRTGKPVSEKTEVWLAHRPEGLFIAFKCHESNMKGVVSNMLKRGGALWRDDDVEVFLLPNGGGVPMQFALNAIGTQSDNIGNDKPWQGAARRAADAWTGELFIPYSALGVARQPVDRARWKIQVGRQQKPKGEISAWTRTDSFATVGRFGILEFDRPDFF